MSSLDASSDTVTLWRPTGQDELELVAASEWQAWPPRLPEQPIFYPVLNRWYATKIAREWNVRSGGVGYVTSFDVRKSYLDQFPVQQAGGREVLEYWIPAEELAEFNENIVGKIREVACYVGPVAEEEFTRTEAALGQRFPDAWEEAAVLHPGVMMLGGNGSRENLVVDSRDPQSPVTMVDITSEGWQNALLQMPVEQFIRAVEAGTFEFSWE